MCTYNMYTKYTTLCYEKWTLGLWHLGNSMVRMFRRKWPESEENCVTTYGITAIRIKDVFVRQTANIIRLKALISNMRTSHKRTCSCREAYEAYFPAIIYCILCFKRRLYFITSKLSPLHAFWGYVVYLVLEFHTFQEPSRRFTLKMDIYDRDIQTVLHM